MEIWDGYLVDGSLAGVDLVRGEAVPSGLYHLCCEVLVRHTDGDFLLMERDPRKPSYPSYFEATAGGSALKGEDARTCALRELKEETGIAPLSLTEVGVYTSDNTIFSCFVALTDCDKGAIKLQEGETVSFLWLSEKEFKEFITSGRAIPFQRRHFAEYFEAAGYLPRYEIVKISGHSELISAFADRMHAWWGIPREAYAESMSAASAKSAVPEWYAILLGGEIIGGAGVIENDFHPRRELSPNVCAVYISPEHRGYGLAGRLLSFIARDMKERGVDTLYLLTDHTDYYERFGWRYLCPVTSFGEEIPSRMYIHKE